MATNTQTSDIPETITNPDNGTTYERLAFYGKGGFAKCYEIKNISDNRSYAGKIVSKMALSKQLNREKMTQEVWIHKSLRHNNIVMFHSFFEDKSNVYIVLELCTKKSMMELHKRRKTLTEPETRYYMKQIINGVDYLHQQKIIHRDLKLGNLFLSGDLTVKIGDFGLATRVMYANERKKTLCGTPNYIAPEILNKKGHSFEVDIWSMGCIMYTLICGRPPFETHTLKETYGKIMKCQYKWITTSISEYAKTMIRSMLQAEPHLRPKVSALYGFDFLQGFCPTSLPITSLSMTPRFTENRQPLLELHHGDNGAILPAQKKEETIAKNMLTESCIMFDSKENYQRLFDMIMRVLKTRPARDGKLGEEMSDPNSQPMYWVSKWVDYSDKYGFGYQLSDGTVGVLFNDMTKILLLPNDINVHYIDRQGSELFMTTCSYPTVCDKKMKLLLYFSRYMKENLVMMGASAIKESDSVSRVPSLFQWYRFTTGVLMQLNNGTVQVNFGDHTKIIMCPLMGAVTYVDENASFRTFKFDTIIKHGCSFGLHDKLRYAMEKISNFLENPDK